MNWKLKQETKPEAKPTDDAPDVSPSGSSVETLDNNIFFYEDVSDQSVRQLVLQLRKVNVEMAALQVQLGLQDPLPINLHISSYGGSLTAGFAALDEIRNSRSPVTSIVAGVAASAATIMSVAAHKRLVQPHAHMLIHQLSWALWGKASEMEDDYQNIKTLMKMIKQVYKQYTKVPMKKLDEILKHDLYWDPQQCLDYGLVDGIIEN